MEDSNIKAEYVYYCDANIDPVDVYNISDLSEYVKDYNFGDLVAFSDYRDTATFFIGKEGKLIHNPDYSYSGYLTVPYEITQYLDNAVNKYKDLDPMFIDLRYDDKFVLENINTKSCKILKSWNWKLIYSDYHGFTVEFPDGKEHSFDINNISAYKIKKWYEASLKPQSKLKVKFKVEGLKYHKFKKYSENNRNPKIPSTWSFSLGGCGGGLESSYSDYIYQGPLDEEEKVIKSIEKYYKGYNFKITKLSNNQ